MKLTIKKSDVLEDWYLIQRAEHDGRRWLEHGTTKYGSFAVLRCSSRFSDADVEGSSSEMLAIAAAIEDRREVSFKRCSVRIDSAAGRAYFNSPRNSTEDGWCTLAEADELSKMIREVCVMDGEAHNGKV